MTRNGKPHLYKVRGAWHCKCRTWHDVLVLGPARDAPASAYRAFKEIAFYRGGIVFRDNYPNDPRRV